MRRHRALTSLCFTRGVMQSVLLTVTLYLCPYHRGGISGRSQWGGGSKAGGLPTLPSPLSLPSPFPFSLSFQTNQWEGRSDPVRGKFPGFPPYKYHPAYHLCLNFVHDFQSHDENAFNAVDGCVDWLEELGPAEDHVLPRQ